MSPRRLLLLAVTGVALVLVWPALTSVYGELGTIAQVSPWWLAAIGGGAGSRSPSRRDGPAWVARPTPANSSSAYYRVGETWLPCVAGEIALFWFERRRRAPKVAAARITT